MLRSLGIIVESIFLSNILGMAILVLLMRRRITAVETRVFTTNTQFPSCFFLSFRAPYPDCSQQQNARCGWMDVGRGGEVLPQLNILWTTRRFDGSKSLQTNRFHRKWTKDPILKLKTRSITHFFWPRAPIVDSPIQHKHDQGFCFDANDHHAVFQTRENPTPMLMHLIGTWSKS